MAFTQSYLPELPTTDFMFNAEEVGRDKLNYASVGTLFDPDKIPAHLLPVAFANLAASPLYWENNPDEINRELYRKLHDRTDPDQNEDSGILHNKGGERSLIVFSDTVGVVYQVDFTKNASGRKTGINFQIHPVETTRANLYNTSAGQVYLTEAFRFLLPVKFQILSLLIVFPSQGSMFIQGTQTQVGLGGDL